MLLMSCWLIRACKPGFILCSGRLGHQGGYLTLQAAAEASGTVAGASGTVAEASGTAAAKASDTTAAEA